MTLKTTCVILALLGTTPIAGAQPAETVHVGTPGSFVPAGALLGCTLDEPNFSSRTARPGDPVLCRTTSLTMFGRTVIPRGAYLSARLRNFRDPGHFVGKGWMQLEFTSLTLPGGSIPVDAKVISAARYRVNGEGKIEGRGHPKRDAVEWAIPLLWPVKVLTLPARGPRPALKGETRIELRLMEDLVIPDTAYSTSAGLITRPSASTNPASSRFADFRPDLDQPPVTSASFQPSSPPQPRPTMLVLRDGRMYMTGEYWIDRANLDFMIGGKLHAVPLDSIDVLMTRQLNAERGVAFAPASKRR